jgi:indole-3-glycerol phosphate synthase
MACLTEVHDEADLEIAVNAGSDIIGINNRNLDTFTVDINTTHRLASLVPDDRVRVSESGILGGGDVRVLLNAGIQAVLVGSSLMQSENPAEKAAEIVKAGENG